MEGQQGRRKRGKRKGRKGPGRQGQGVVCNRKNGNEGFAGQRAEAGESGLPGSCTIRIELEEGQQATRCQFVLAPYRNRAAAAPAVTPQFFQIVAIPQFQAFCRVFPDVAPMRDALLEHYKL